MHNAAFVRVGERIEDIVENATHIPWCQARGGVEGTPERLPVDVRHGEPQQAVIIPGGQQWHDMGMLELRRQLNFAAEALHIDAGCQLGGEHFHHHAALEGALRGHEDARHASPTELALDQELAVKGALESILEVAHGLLTRNQRSGTVTARYPAYYYTSERGTALAYCRTLRYVHTVPPFTHLSVPAEMPGSPP